MCSTESPSTLTSIIGNSHLAPVLLTSDAVDIGHARLLVNIAEATPRFAPEIERCFRVALWVLTLQTHHVHHVWLFVCLAETSLGFALQIEHRLLGTVGVLASPAHHIHHAKLLVNDTKKRT